MAIETKFEIGLNYNFGLLRQRQRDWVVKVGTH